LITVTPLAGPVGAQVSFDYNGDWDEQVVDTLRQTFERYHLLLLKAPDLKVEKQIELIETLRLEPDEWRDGEKYGYLSNSRKSAPNDGQHSAYLYHSDLMWKPQPISAISLYAVAVQSEPSPTFFASGVGAAAALPEDLRDAWSREEAMFLIDFNGGDARYSEETASPEAPRAVHGVLFEDVISQQMSLIIDSLFMVKIMGLGRDQSEALRDRAHEYLYAEDNVYRHDWQVGDLVVWNNIALQHARKKLPDAGERTFRRVSGTRSGGITGWETNYKKVAAEQSKAVS
jgi:alpha-ketoglutarate-dependent taurine dioxygenase